ncbi:helix-turn-helix domain-containing protein [Luteimonas sp. RIT-PG2_3]
MTPSEAIAHLKHSGMTELVIAAAVGARQSTINRIRHGQMQPTYGLGRALVDMAEALDQPKPKKARAA